MAQKTRHTLIQAPTGTGKSLIALALAKLSRSRSTILTANKGLAEQYRREAPWLTDVRGMSNYPCLAAQDEFQMMFPITKAQTCDSGPCRSGATCTLKESGCEYFDAVRAAQASRTVLTNYDYWIASRRYGAGLGAVDLLVCDEAHASPERLMSASRLVMPGYILPRVLPRTAMGWRQWAESTHDRLKRQKPSLDQRMRVQRLLDNLERLASDLGEGWAWEILPDDSVAFEPITAAPFLGDLTNGVKHLVHLSATITPTTLRLLGVDPTDVRLCVLESGFPLEARPVWLMGSARVDFRMTEQAMGSWLQDIDTVIGDRLDRKGLVHTISYQRQQFLLDHSQYRGIMLAPRRASELERTIQEFRQSAAPKVLVSPAIMTGYDFPYQDAEYQIIVKVPFPDTRSSITKQRLKAIPGYRDYLTMQALVQAVGRIMRAADDQGETLIVDAHARWFLREHADLAPRAFLDAVHVTGRIPRPFPPL